MSEDGRAVASPVSPSPNPAMLHSAPRHSVRAVSLYRSKFSDWPAGAVPNSYPKLDLLWDNLIAGLLPWLRYGASCSPGPLVVRSGRLQNARADDSGQRTLYVG
jgi:hypothetical protein